MASILIDTATEYAVIAFFDDEKIIYQQILPFGFQHSKTFLLEVETALKSLMINPKELKYVAVGTGPGSYTGIRVGVVVAKAFAYVATLPLVSFSSLTGFIPLNNGPFTVILDAKISGAYTLFGKRSGSMISYEGTAASRPLESLHDALHSHPTLVSPHLSTLRPKIEKLFPDLHLSWIESKPDIPHLVNEARKRFHDGHYTTDGTVDVLYLRKTQAEIERGM